MRAEWSRLLVLSCTACSTLIAIFDHQLAVQILARSADKALYFWGLDEGDLCSL